MVKKTLLLLISLLLIIMVFGVALAEDTVKEKKPFDRTVYESAPNFTYDKFNNTWTTWGYAGKQYSDAYIQIGLQVWGDNDRITAPPMIYVWCRDASNQVTKFKITGLQIIANDIIFSASNIFVDENGNTSYMYLDSKNGKALAAAIAEGSELEFKIIYGTGSFVERITGNDYLGMKQLAQILLDNDTWAYVLDDNGNDISAHDSYINASQPIEIIGHNDVKDITPALTHETTSESILEPFVEPLNKRSKGDEVKKLNQRLIDLKYLKGKAEKNYTNTTINAVKQFQVSAGITLTGEVDEETWNALFAQDAPGPLTYEKFDFQKLARNGDDYIGKNFKFDGTVSWVAENVNNSNGSVIVAMGINTRGKYKDGVYIAYERKDGEQRYIEKDKVTIYGKYIGLYSYSAVSGAMVTLPRFELRGIELKNK